uniref:TNF receptor superfamily member 12A n=1 Tax=Rattus norvegicus TaxID=10116 RepID=A0A8I6AVJ2_RAT
MAPGWPRPLPQLLVLGFGLVLIHATAGEQAPGSVFQMGKVSSFIRSPSFSFATCPIEATPHAQAAAPGARTSTSAWTALLVQRDHTATSAWDAQQHLLPTSGCYGPFWEALLVWPWFWRWFLVSWSGDDAAGEKSLLPP